MLTEYEEDRDVTDPFETRAFYELCQRYRHMPMHRLEDVAGAFEALKRFGRDAAAYINSQETRVQ